MYNYYYLYASSFADMDPPQTVEAIWVRLGVCGRKDCASAFSQIATAGNCKLNKIEKLHSMANVIIVC